MLKKKTLFIIFLAFVFILFAPVLVLYANGYRIDFRKFKILKTGAIYIKTYPNVTDVFINGKFIKKTDLFLGEAFLKNLLPANYNIEIKKDGYFPWQKNLEVFPGLVTKADNIFLFKEKLNLKKIAENLDYFFVLSEDKILIKEKNTFNFWFFDKNDNSLNKIFDEKKEKLNSKIINFKVFFSSNKNQLLFEFFLNNGKREFFKFNILENSLKLVEFKNINLKNLERIEILDNGEIYLKVGKNLYKKTDKEKLPKLILNNVLTFISYQKFLYYLDDKGYLVRFNRLSLKKEILSTEPIKIRIENKKSKFKIEVFQDKIFLLKSDELFYFDNGKFKKIIDNVEKFGTKTKNNQVLILKNQEIWIFDLKTLEVKFLARFSKKIKNSYFLNPFYIVFQKDDDLEVIEKDFKNKPNLYTLNFYFNNKKVKGKISNFDIKDGKNIYLLVNSSLFLSKVF